MIVVILCSGCSLALVSAGMAFAMGANFPFVAIAYLCGGSLGTVFGAALAWRGATLGRRPGPPPD